MKRKLLPILLLALLVGCNKIDQLSDSQDLNSETSIISSSEDKVEGSSEKDSSEIPPSSDDPVTSEVPPSSEDSSVSEEKPETLSDLDEIRTLALTYTSLVNEKGVYKSDVYAEFTAQLLTLQDYITTQSGYNNRYKAFVANETGYLTVNLNYAQYDLMKNYKAQQQVYKFKGYVGLYNGEVEVDMDGLGKVEYLAGVTLPYDYKTFASEGGTIATILGRIKSAPINTKGISWSTNIVKVTLKYLAKIENEVALFSDGMKIIQVHGHDKLNNGFTLNDVYEIYAREGLYQFKPSLEYIGHRTVSSAISVDYNLISELSTAANIYNYKYTIDDDRPYVMNANYAYTDLLTKVFYFEGYANYYQKDASHFVVIEDTAKESFYTTYTAAFGAKALFVNNAHSTNIKTTTDWENSPFNYYVDGPATEKVKIGLYFVGYAYNTQKYWQVQVLENTIVEL